jgi:segregation and condensation protein A
MTYVVDLEAFHGPLDLLLYLIDRNEIDIYDIPIAVITDQYLHYLQLTGDFDLDKLGDFLGMASYLLNLKSRMLLPANGDQPGGDEVDPREELVQRLVEYRRYKKAAEYLMARQNEDFARVFYRDAEVLLPVKEEISADLDSLIRAYRRVLSDIQEDEPAVFAIPDGDINVESKMDEIMESLKLSPEGIVFQDLFTGNRRKREVLVLFLALLELIRLQQVAAIQENSLTEIKVFLRVAI